MKKVALIGVGMIGCSWALALKKAGIFEQIIGIDNDEQAILKALKKGVIDISSSIEDLEPVDAIILATPVGAMPSVFKQLKEKSFIDDVIMSDVGSTKQSVIQACMDSMGYLPRQFVPSHPIAGKEFIGVDYATSDMFHGYKAIITPHKNMSEVAKLQVVSWWEACGATVDFLSPKAHDSILAITSHVPHILAYGLMETIRNADCKNPVLDYAAGGFESFSRTASSNPIMWRDICIKNKEEVIVWLDAYQASINQIKSLIKDSNSDELLSVFTNAKQERDINLVEKRKQQKH